MRGLGHSSDQNVNVNEPLSLWKELMRLIADRATHHLNEIRYVVRKGHDINVVHADEVDALNCLLGSDH